MIWVNLTSLMWSNRNHTQKCTYYVTDSIHVRFKKNGQNYCMCQNSVYSWGEVSALTNRTSEVRQCSISWFRLWLHICVQFMKTYQVTYSLLVLFLYAYYTSIKDCFKKNKKAIVTQWFPKNYMDAVIRRRKIYSGKAKPVSCTQVLHVILFKSLSVCV